MAGMGVGAFGGCRGICSERTAYSTNINSQKASEIVLNDIVGLGGARGKKVVVGIVGAWGWLRPRLQSEPVDQK